MILTLHIFIAVSSLVITTLACLTPSVLKLRSAFVLIGLTLASGLYLIISTHVPLLQACMSGIGYLAMASSGVAYARLKLARFNQ